MVFNAQNAGNRLSEYLDLNFFFFWGGGVGGGGKGACPQTPLGERVLAAPLVVRATYFISIGHLQLELLKPLVTVMTGQGCTTAAEMK